MKKLLLSLFGCFILLNGYSQTIPKIYYEHIQVADSLRLKKDYLKAAKKYTDAFISNNGKGILNDRYNAACMWSLAQQPDSAFYQLNRIATKGNFSDIFQLDSDPDLFALHPDPRWNSLMEIVQKNLDLIESKKNQRLSGELETIYVFDQIFRQQLDSVEHQFGWNSKEIERQWKAIQAKDSMNQIRVSQILDTFGWLGPEILGEVGSNALFLVVQHAGLAFQQKYLPLLREAVQKDRASGADLALLEDRVALREGRRQIYGSQIARNPKTLEYYVSPLDDPEHVDERRAKVGLPPLAEYVSNWQINWDAKVYKKNLKALEHSLKR